MIPIMVIKRRRAHWRMDFAMCLAAVAACAGPVAVTPLPDTPTAPVAPVAPIAPTAPISPTASVAPASCLESGDGYFRARLAGAIEANIDWPNSGTQCE